MTKAELIAKLQEKAGLKSKASAGETLDSLLDIIRESVANGGAVTLTGFGTFKVAERGARKGRNPQTGKEIQIPAAKRVKFSAGKALKDAVK